MIRQINDTEGLRQEIGKRVAKREQTNFFMQEAEYRPLVEAGRMTQMAVAGGIYLFVEQKGWKDFYFFLERGAKPAPLDGIKGKLVLSEVLLASKPRLPSQEDWEQLGFAAYLQRKRLFLVKPENDSGEVAVFADRTHADAIFTLMQDSFEPLTSAFLSKEELLHDIMQNRIIVLEEEGQLLGFLHFETKKNLSTLWHIAVSPVAQGRGIGERLVRTWLREEAVNRFLLWVREDNPAALRMYEKIGFLPDGRIAPVMIKEDERMEEE